MLKAEFLKLFGGTIVEEIQIFAGSKPRPEVHYLILGQGTIKKRLGQVESSMSQIISVSVGKGVRDLNDEEVDHSNKLARDRLLKKAKLLLFQAIEDIIVTVAVLSHLHIAAVIAVDLVRRGNIWCLGHQIDPRVNDLIYLGWRRICRSDEVFDLRILKLLKDKLLVERAGALYRPAFRSDNVTLWRNYIAYL